MSERKAPAPPYGRLPDFLAQELVLLTRISDLTKEIEVQSRQREIRLEDLPERRQVYIGRLKKCRRAAAGAAAELPPEQRARAEAILAGNFAGPPRGKEESSLLRTAEKCRAVLRATLADDREARKKIRAECGRLRARIRAARENAQ